jgi:arsenate reductase
MTTVYHNPRCKKSREALKILHELGENVTVVEYLKDCPSHAQLREILSQLGIPAEQLVRKTEAIYKSDYKGKELTEEEWIAAMVAHPILIERPIVIKGNKAVIGRPADNVHKIL